MSRKRRSADKAPEPENANRVVRVEGREGECVEATLARARLAPFHSAVNALWRLDGPAGIGWSGQGAVDELERQAAAASSGDLTRLEAILTTQAHMLDAIFNRFTERAALNAGEYPDAMERYMRLALRAQGQCRATIETLAEIKNPKSVAFVRQANIAGGHQQVNNNPARAGSSNSANEILEDSSGERLEQSTQGKAVVGHSPLAALGAGDGAEIARGQGPVGAEQPQARRV